MGPSGLVIAGDAAFGIVFGAFVAALAVLAVVAVRWGVRRDRLGREAWRQRQIEAMEAERRQANQDGSGGNLR